MFFIRRLSHLFLLCVFSLSLASVSARYTTLSEWTEANRQGKLSGESSVLTSEEFIEVLKDCRYAIEECVFEKTNCWLKNDAPTNSFFQVDSNNECYLQKLVVNPKSKICFMGDLHGSVDSLLNNLNKLASDKYIDDNFEIISDKFYMIFLGDYVDRGPCGVEVLSILSLLKSANPDEVFLLRGNHEELGGFKPFEEELKAKFKEQAQTVQDVFLETVKFFPAAIFLKSGTNFAQCCHGGIELWYSPLELMASDKLFEKYTKHIEISGGKELAVDFGFVWSDFDFLGKKDSEYKNAYDLSVRGGSTLVFHREITKKYLEKHSTLENKFVAFFRGHQHALFGLKMLNKHHKNLGILSSRAHWNNIVSFNEVRDKEINIATYHPVFTFSTAGGVPSCYVPYDCYGILKVEKAYKDWKLKVYETKRSDAQETHIKEQVKEQELLDHDDNVAIDSGGDVEDFFEKETKEKDSGQATAIDEKIREEFQKLGLSEHQRRHENSLEDIELEEEGEQGDFLGDRQKKLKRVKTSIDLECIEEGEDIESYLEEEGEEAMTVEDAIENAKKLEQLRNLRMSVCEQVVDVSFERLNAKKEEKKSVCCPIL